MEPGSLLGGKYRLRHVLGEGAMGVVWAATNELTDRTVALKLIPRAAVQTEELKMRLLREARACGRISHRNVVQVYDVGESDGDPFLVMEMLTGDTLAGYLKTRKRLPVPEAAKLARDIAKGLSAAHAAGIIHRDLKPANVFLHHEPGDDAQVVKVLDFGVSKALTAEQASVTSTGGAIGSPAYMSPEQARGFARIDPRSDLWALGVVLFEMIAGRLPFTGDTPYEVVAEILKGPIPLLADVVPGVDPAMSDLVASCLQRDPESRISSAQEMVAVLPTFLEGRFESSLITQLPPSKEPEPAVAQTLDSSLLKTATSTTPVLHHWDDVTKRAQRPGGTRIARFAVAGGVATVLALTGAYFATRTTKPESATPSAPSTGNEPALSVPTPTPTASATPAPPPTPSVSASASSKVKKPPVYHPPPSKPPPAKAKPTSTGTKESPWTSPG